MKPRSDLKILMTECNVSMKEVADEMNMSYARLSHFINGYLSIPPTIEADFKRVLLGINQRRYDRNSIVSKKSETENTIKEQGVL